MPRVLLKMLIEHLLCKKHDDPRIENLSVSLDQRLNQPSTGASLKSTRRTAFCTSIAICSHQIACPLDMCFMDDLQPKR